MNKLEISFDVEELTFDEVIDIQEGNLRRAKGILAKFAVGPDGKPLPPEAADEAIGRLKVKQIRDVFAEFGKQVNEAMQETLPNGRGPK